MVTPPARRLTLTIVLLSAALTSAIAQDMGPSQERAKLIKAPQALGVLGDNLFGDSVNFYSGALSFVQTDVSLRGNNALPVAVGRRLATGVEAKDRTHFGHWELDIPHIRGMFSTRYGWINSSGAAGARCSQPSVPPAAKGDQNTPYTWAGTEYWHGNFMYVPGHGDQELLKRSPGFTSSPGVAANYPQVTRNNWAISCVLLPNSTTEEGFIATAPDGTKYRFDWKVSRPAGRISKTNASPDLESFSSATAAKGIAGAEPTPTPMVEAGSWLSRTEVFFYPTVITDKFGNTVTYAYDATNRNRLKTITGSDGRVITLTYPDVGGVSNLVSTVSDGSNTWTYAYSSTSYNATLTTVTQPDGKTWQLGGMYPLMANVDYIGEGNCDLPGNLNPVAATGYMIHPSGARGDFTLTPTRHGRAGVTNECITDFAAQTQMPRYPKIFDTLALTNKTLSGPGLPTTQWTTSYSTEESSWAPCSGCDVNKTVDVTDPAGNKTRYTFGTLFKMTEGQQQLVEVFNGSNSLLRTTQTRYDEPIPPRGTSEQRRGDGEMAARVTEVDRRIISQQGVDFTWLVNVFDTTARPTSVTRSSSLGMSRTETTIYSDNTPKWVLGQVGSVTESSTGNVIAANTYDLTTTTLTTVSKFGNLMQTFGYNGNGTLLTFSDGKNNTTTFSNYKRGIAQNVLYANGSAESAVVNNNGTVASITNQAGFTTSYGYDAMRRLTSITQPAGGAVAWNPTTLTYTQVASTEFDLPPGHWRQQTTTGNARTTTYYDALFRPAYTETQDLASPATTSRIIKHRYDFAGRTTFTSYPQRTYAEIAAGVNQEYDALGRPTVTSAASELGTLYSGNSYGGSFQTTSTDARGKSTLYSYQAFDQPRQDAIISAVMPENVNVAINRDIFGKTLSVVRSGGGKSLTRSYVYDEKARLCKTIEPETQSTVQNYDLANNVEWRASGLALPSTSSCDHESVAAAKKTTFGYDTLNRLTSTNYGDGSAGITRTYTADSLPSTITSNGAVWTYGYNNRRVNDSESLAYGGTTYAISRTFDANGSLSLLTYPDTSSVSYLPNALGEPSKVGSYASAITYYPNGALKTFTYGNGKTHSTNQNLRQLPSQSIDSGVLNDSYTYDGNGNVLTVADGQEAVTSRTMVYDDLSRLMSVSAPNLWGTASYGYDAIDNIVSSAVTAGATMRSASHEIDPATNRLTGVVSGTSAYNLAYGYDAQGNVIQRGSQTYVFDQANRLNSAPGKGTYTYDGHGRRVSVVSIDAVNRVQMYSQEGKMLYTRATSVPLASGTKYIYLGKHVIAENSAAGVQYDHTDALGSPVAISNAAGTVTSRTRYEPYGLTASGTVPVMGFTGHMNAEEIGLVYMQQRYYDPVAGRFLSIDPVTTDANTGDMFNRYNYAYNNPYKYVDPDGRFGLIGAAIGGGVEIGLQLYNGGKVDNWTAVGLGVASGALTGGIGGLIGKAAVAGASVRTGIIAGAAVGGAAGAGSKLVEASLTGEKIGSSDVAVAAAAGAVGGGVGTAIGLKAVAVLNKMANAPGVTGHIGSTTQSAIQQSGSIVGPATTAGQVAGLTATEVASSKTEQKLNEK
jgi:RHS repeat-associated protein